MIKSLSLPIFLISPMLGIVTALLEMMSSKEKKGHGLLFSFLFSIFLGLLNAGKIIESDLANYEIWYDDVINYSLLEYVFYQKKEPIFFLYNYLVYYFTGGDFAAYIVITTALGYSIFSFSIYRLHMSLRCSRYFYYCALIALFLFPNLFSLSAHLIRQFLASSLLSMLIVELIFYRKTVYYVFISSVFVHTSSLIFSFIYLFERLKNRALVRVLFLAALAVIVLVVLRNPKIFDSITLGAEFLNYGVSRLKYINLSYVDFSDLSIITYAFCVYIVVIFYFAKSKVYSGMSSLFYFSLFLLIFLILSSSNNEVALRFSFYFYGLFPFALYLFLASFFCGTKFSNVVLMVLILVLFSSWFLFEILNGVWSFNGLDRVIINNFVF